MKVDHTKTKLPSRYNRRLCKLQYKRERFIFEVSIFIQVVEFVKQIRQLAHIVYFNKLQSAEHYHYYKKLNNLFINK